MMNNKVRKTKRGRLVATIAAVALLAVACGIGIRAYAQSSSAPKPVNGASKVDTQSTQSAPQTDSQTDADARLADSLKNALSTSSEGLTEVRHPDGTVTVDLEGRFQNFSVAKVNPDGTITTECVSDAKEVDQFFGTDKAKTAAKPTVKSIESTPKARRKN